MKNLLKSKILKKERLKIKAFFVRKVVFRNLCWEIGDSDRYWPIKTNSYGNIGAHRLSFLLFKGRVGYKVIRHKCDNKKCIKPSHLETGTFSDNIMDSLKKDNYGRIKRKVGERVKNSKLKAREVREIRCSSLSVKELSKKYNVCITTIAAVIDRHTWKHIK